MTDISAKAAQLRAIAMSRATQNHPVTFVLDDTLRLELESARDALRSLEEKRAALMESGDLPEPKAPVPASLGEAPQETQPHLVSQVEKYIEMAEHVVETIENEVKGSNTLLLVNLRRLSPADYQAQVERSQVAARKAAAKDRHLDADSEFLRDLGSALLKACYVCSTTVGGEDLGLTLDDLLDGVLGHRDWEMLRNEAIAINRSGAAIPFVLTNSGNIVKP